MKQTKITKIEELLQKAMQENSALKAAEQEAQQVMSEMNEDAEDYELEIQTLKLRVCDLQATKTALEKKNSVLNKTDESDRVRESLRKLGELEKEYQTVSFAKDELQVQLAEMKDILEQSKAQRTVLQRHQQQTEQQLSDVEIQCASVIKENLTLKENIVRLEDNLRASEIEKDELKSEVKLAQKIKKRGYSRGGLFIGNQDDNSELKPEGKANMKFRGPQTSTPLTSPRGTVHSKSFERPAPKQRALKRYYSLDSLNASKSNRDLNGRLSTSLENLGIDWSREDDVTPEVMDTSFDSLNGSEYSVDLSEAGGVSRKLGKQQSSEEVRVKGLEDWETLSEVSSVVTADTFVLTDLDNDIDTEQGDTESVRSLKQRFEQPGVKQPAKITRRRSSSLTSAPTLTTLVEKHEEATSNSEEAKTVSEMAPSTSDIAATISDSLTKPSDVCTIPPGNDARPSDAETGRTAGYATSSDGDPKVSVFPSNREILDIASKEAYLEVLASPHDVEPKNNIAKSMRGNDSINLSGKDGSCGTETILSDTLSSPDDFEPNSDKVEISLDGFLGTEVRASMVHDKQITRDPVAKSPSTDIESQSISQKTPQSEGKSIEWQVKPDATKSSDVKMASEVTNCLPQPDKSRPTDVLVPVDSPPVTYNPPMIAEAENIVIGSDPPSITDSTPNIADGANPKANENKFSSVKTDTGQSLVRSPTVTKKSKLLVVNPDTVENSDVKVKVKDMRSLWEKRENRRSNSQKVQFRKEETNVGGKKASPFVSRSLKTASSQASGVGNNGDESSGETPKLAKVSDLVSLWSNFN